MTPGVTPLPVCKGTYVLVMQALSPCVVEAGRLGCRELPTGWYLYVGSAFGVGGVAARCSRHARTDKPLRWHVDYLRRRLELAEIWVSCGPGRLEHHWASLLEDCGELSNAWPRFGASDCRCTSHLWYCPDRPSPADVFSPVMVDGIQRVYYGGGA